MIGHSHGIHSELLHTQHTCHFVGINEIVPHTPDVYLQRNAETHFNDSPFVQKHLIFMNTNDERRLTMNNIEE